MQANALAEAIHGSYIPRVPPDILLVRFSAMGDIILTTPLIRAIRARHPGATLTYVTKSLYEPLLARSPHLNEVIGWEPGLPLADLAARLAGRNFTHRLDLHRSLRSRLLRLRLGGRWTSYPKHRIARGVLIRTKRDVYRDRRHVVERFFDAARDLDVTPDARPAECFVSAGSVEAAGRFLAERDIGTSRQLIALAPGSAHATKRWPLHHWVDLAHRLAGLGNDLVLVGGSGEAEVAARIAETAGVRAALATGSFDLEGTAALLKRCRALIAGDTGVMHLATAVGTPLVALIGPTVRQFGYFPYQAKAVVLEKDLPCRPCSAYGSKACPLSHHRCMQDLMPEEVVDALRKLPR